MPCDTDAIAIPNEAVRYILLQRTAHLRLTRTPAYKVASCVIPMLYPLVVRAESRFRRSTVKRLYATDMQAEYDAIRGALPETCDSVLDIGCGVAGIDAILARHYAPCPVRFYLLDKTHVERKVFYNFRSRGAFYNSLDVARDLMACNGVPAESVCLLSATDDNAIDVDAPVDLVISLISWGFHYPIATYLERVTEVLSPRGCLILDVRKNTGGGDLIRNTFRHVRAIAENTKSERLVAAQEAPTLAGQMTAAPRHAHRSTHGTPGRRQTTQQG